MGDFRYPDRKCGANVQIDVRFDVEQLAQTLNNEQMRALFVGMAQVIAASRVLPQPKALDAFEAEQGAG